MLNVSPRAVKVVRVAAPAFLGNYSLALRRDGRVFGWGANANGLTNPPAAISNVVGITAGPVHALAIRGDGRVVGWGSTTGGGLIIPESATNIVAVVAGANSTGLGFSLALRNDGAILGWGATSQVQLAQLPVNLSSAFALGAGSSHAVAATASRAPRFVNRLGDLVAYEGRDFALNALVVGAAPLAYQWRFDGTDLAGATQPTLRLTNVTSASAGLYSVVVSNRLGVLEGEVAQLAVEPVPFAPAIVKSPASQTVWAGTNVTLSVEVTASPAPTFQWQRNGQDISDATGSTYTIPYAVPGHAGAYRVVVSNPEGTATSADALLTVGIPAWPTLKALEPSRVVSLGSPLLLAVTANGTPPIHYQWRRNGADLPGVTGPSLSLATFEFEDGGVYSVVMSNASGVAESPGALISPCPVAVWGTGLVTNLPIALSNPVAIAAGKAHALALKADGTVVAWGEVRRGDVDSGQVNVPAGLKDVVAIAAGEFHNLAVRSDGTVAAWGGNAHGQIDVPSDLTDVIAIDAGADDSLALRADGTVAAWGEIEPPPAGLDGVVALAAGAGFGLALRADGALVQWGAAEPAGVPEGLSDVTSMSAGWHHALAVVGDGRPAVTVQPFHRATVRDGRLTVHVRAMGLAPLHYQWRRDGVDLPEATAPTLLLFGDESELVGTYAVRVSNALGAVESASCRVGPPPGPWFDTSPGAIGLEPDGLHMVLLGLSGNGTVRVWASGDLRTWDLVLTHEPVVGRLDLVDPTASLWPVRFYRAVEGE